MTSSISPYISSRSSVPVKGKKKSYLVVYDIYNWHDGGGTVYEIVKGEKVST